MMLRHTTYMGFPGGSDSKESACNEGDLGSVPGSGRFPGEGNNNNNNNFIILFIYFNNNKMIIPWRRKPLQYSCLENSMDRGA